MVYVVTDKCTKCKRCVDVCPIGCFHDSDKQLIINPNECIDCGACAMECPIKAIKHEAEASLEEITFNKEQAAKCQKA